MASESNNKSVDEALTQAVSKLSDILATAAATGGQKKYLDLEGLAEFLGNITGARDVSAVRGNAKVLTVVDGKLRLLPIEEVYAASKAYEEDYYGIEFTRHTSDGGGENGYHKMIGSEEALAAMPVHNLIRMMAVVNGKKSCELNQVNIFKDADGNDVDVAGPNGEDFMLGFTGDATVYAILGGTDETYDRYIFGTKPFTYEGDEAIAIKPFAESLDYSTIVDNRQRCIYDENVAGSMGTQNACITEGFERFRTSGGYPRTSISRINYELYARNKNEDNTLNVPYCNTNMLDATFWMGLLFVECRTKFLTKVFGNGLSSNVTPTASNWGTVTGARITEADGTAHYYTMSNTALYIEDATGTSTQGEDGAEPLFIHRDEAQVAAMAATGDDAEEAATSNGTEIEAMLTGSSYSHLTVMEAQRDISMGCVEGTFEGVAAPDGTPLAGLDDGVMTGIWTLVLDGKIMCAFNADDEVKECDIQVVYRHPVWRGWTRLFGNIWNWTSGEDVLLYIDEDGTRHNHLYRARDIESIATDSDTSNKDNAEDWAFVSERGYEYIGDLGGTNGWCNDLLRNAMGMTLATALRTASGAGRETYEGAYTYLDDSTTTQGKYIRRAVRRGGRLGNTNSVFRSAYASGAPSLTLAHFGGGFRVALP